MKDPQGSAFRGIDVQIKSLIGYGLISHKFIQRIFFRLQESQDWIQSSNNK